MTPRAGVAVLAVSLAVVGLVVVPAARAQDEQNIGAAPENVNQGLDNMTHGPVGTVVEATSHGMVGHSVQQNADYAGQQLQGGTIGTIVGAVEQRWDQAVQTVDNAVNTVNAAYDAFDQRATEVIVQGAAAAERTVDEILFGTSSGTPAEPPAADDQPPTAAYEPPSLPVETPPATSAPSYDSPDSNPADGRESPAAPAVQPDHAGDAQLGAMHAATNDWMNGNFGSPQPQESPVAQDSVAATQGQALPPEPVYEAPPPEPVYEAPPPEPVYEAPPPEPVYEAPPVYEPPPEPVYEPPPEPVYEAPSYDAVSSGGEW
jgi:hypothetical protein